MTLFFGPQIVAVPNGNKDMHIAIKGQGVALERSHVLKLRNCLTAFLGDAPPIVADDKVEALIQAAREWQQRIYPTKPPIAQPSTRLYHAIMALDPPEDPDKALIEEAFDLVYSTLRSHASAMDQIRDIISLVREHDAKTVK